MKCALILLAAGSGQRLATTGNSQPKQYRKLVDKAVIEHALQPFFDHPTITTIQPVISPFHADTFQSILPNHSKLHPFVAGGDTRQASVMQGLTALTSTKPDCVLIHDAARLFIPSTMIDRLVEALYSGHEAVAPALSIADSLRHRENDGTLGETLPRETIMAMQTPQGGVFEKVIAAHKWAEKQAVIFTDDAALMRAFGLKVHTVAGDELARKLTTQADWDLLSGYYRGTRQLETRIGQGFDVHAFGEGSSVVLSGVKIPFDRGLIGHSDADVMLHALTDALLGAIGEGDIGQHFPPNDDRWKDQNSALFLDKALSLIAERHGQIINVDLTLIGERPKLKHHRATMKSRLAQLLALDETRINIKATTTETLGFCGREEGLAAMATAAVSLPFTDQSAKP